MSAVLRVECPEERGVAYGTLLAAVQDPPRDPEARVLCDGRLLAKSRQDVVAWEFTAVGLERLELEARGYDADAILEVMLRDDLARCSTLPAPADSEAAQ